MQLGFAPDPALHAMFRTGGVRLRLAGLSINLRTDLPAVVDHFQSMYGGHQIEPATPGPRLPERPSEPHPLASRQVGSRLIEQRPLAATAPEAPACETPTLDPRRSDAPRPAPATAGDDFRVHVTYINALRRFIRRKTQVFVDGREPFAPTPLRIAYLGIEAALNWCVSSSYSYLVLHAAVVERDGVAALLPAPSTSGKSTLCAALVTRGWRLLSDELGVLSAADMRLRSLARPVVLKNDSIPLIRRWAPDCHLGPVFSGTGRGDIAFLRPPADSVARIAETAVPGLVVSPTFRAQAPVTLQALGKAEAFRLLTANSLNYTTTQRVGFDTVAHLVDTCATYRLSYGTLEQAVDAMETLLEQARTGRRAALGPAGE